MSQRTYEEHILNLFELLGQCNMADTPERQPWQRPRDEYYHGGLYGLVWHVIDVIAGEAILNHWAETHEVDLKLAHRD